MTAPSLPMAARDLMPQSGRMALLDRLTAWTPETAEATVRAEADCPFADADGFLDSLALAEMLAQLLAAAHGYEDLTLGREGAAVGFLVGLQSFEFPLRARVGDLLELSARKTFSLEAVTMIEGEVRRDGAVLAKGTLKVWEQSEAPAMAEMAKADPPSGRQVDWGTRRASPMRRGVVESLRDVVRPEPGVAEGVFVFPERYVGFSGHFPGFPVLPGVAMVQSGLALAEKATGKRLALRGILRAKFMRPASPEAAIEARASVEAEDDDGLLRVRATLSHEGGALAKFTCFAGVEGRE